MGPLIIAPPCGLFVLASIAYLAESIQSGPPRIGVDGMAGFRGLVLPDPNTSYASWIRRFNCQHPKLNLPGEVLDAYPRSSLLHSFTDATSNSGLAVDCALRAGMRQSDARKTAA